MPPLSAYAVSTPGLEQIVAAELRALGLVPSKVEPGGVEFECDATGLYRANLESRTAARILVRIARFKAIGFNDLEKHAKRIDWPALIAPKGAIDFRVTSKKSRLYHGRAIEERLGNLLATRVPGLRIESSERREATDEGDDGRVGQAGQEGQVGPGIPRDRDRGTGNEAPTSDSQLIVVRLFRDQCTISLDSSGDLLHRRGYRQAVAKAPIRENLAAAMLMAAGWDLTGAVLDPMCGSGTIPIEAALMARRIPPGWYRGFSFERWPSFDQPAWRRLRAEAESRMLPRSPVRIVGTDRDGGAIEAAEANARRAGVADDIVFAKASISAIEARPAPGWLVTNPPYGVRVGERETLRNLFAQFGKVVRQQLPGWTVAMLSTHRELEAQTKLGFEDRLEFSNGGIRVRLVTSQVRSEK